MPHGRVLHDAFFRKAKRCGFAARSAFKLIQINDRFKVLNLKSSKSSARYRALDLGCFPGSWSQVVLDVAREKRARVSVVGVDLKHTNLPADFHSHSSFHFIQGDAFSGTTADAIRAHGPVFDAVLSDMCPPLTGAPEADVEDSRRTLIRALGRWHATISDTSWWALAALAIGENRLPAATTEIEETHSEGPGSTSREMSGRGEEVQGAGGEGGGERRVEFEGVEGTDGPDKGELDEMHDRVVTRFEPPSLSNARARGCRDGEGEGDGSPQEISSDGVVAKRRRDTNIGAACAEGKGAGVADSKGVIVGESEVDRVGSSKGVIVGESEVDRVADSKGLRKALEGLLVEGGNFVGKFIMGAGSERIVAVARPHFARVKLYRPQVPAT